jgi:hypothetical protein
LQLWDLESFWRRRLHFPFDTHLTLMIRPSSLPKSFNWLSERPSAGLAENRMNAHFFNRRRFFRRSLNEPAWIDRASNNLLERCTLVNLCEIGARLTIMDVYDLPENFALHLTRGSEPARQCRVIWQRNHEVGVEFLGKAPLYHKAF